MTTEYQKRVLTCQLVAPGKMISIQALQTAQDFAKKISY